MSSEETDRILSRASYMHMLVFKTSELSETDEFLALLTVVIGQLGTIRGLEMTTARTVAAVNRLVKLLDEHKDELFSEERIDT